MKLKQLLEQLKYIIEGAKFVFPLLLGLPLGFYGFSFLQEHGLLKEFFGTLFAILIIIAFCYIVGRLEQLNYKEK